MGSLRYSLTRVCTSRYEKINNFTNLTINKLTLGYLFFLVQYKDITARDLENVGWMGEWIDGGMDGWAWLSGNNTQIHLPLSLLDLNELALAERILESDGHSPSCCCWTLKAVQYSSLCDVLLDAFIGLNLNCSQGGKECSSRKIYVFQPSFAGTGGRPWRTWRIIAVGLVINCKKR